METKVEARMRKLLHRVTTLVVVETVCLVVSAAVGVAMIFLVR